MVAAFSSEAPPHSVKDTIAWLLRLGRPPLPECPVAAAREGKEPKQPCYFDGRRVIPISWKPWQKEQPIADIYETWFANPKTGIGTLGGWNGKHWLGWVDFDQKDFSCPEECDRSIEQWVAQYSIVKSAPMFRTPSGGYRFLIAFNQEPANFKANSGFSLNPDGSHHVGELLTKNGGHSIMPPTQGINGKFYEWVRWCEYPPVVEQPEDVGLYPVRKRTENNSIPKQPRQGSSAQNTNLIEFLERDIYSRLTAEVAFCWSGHDFRQYGDKLKGCCPWHESQSGTAFYVEEKDGKLLWRCPACELGGSVIEYRHRLAGGDGSPRGKDFVDIVGELAGDVGLEMPAIQRDRSSETVVQNKSNAIGTTRALTIEAAVDKAREILKTRHPEIQENILLEKIREKCGLSSYCWEQKFIRPLKRELSGERFKLDLLRLLAIDDDVERLRQQAVLAPLYQMSAGNLQKALQLTKQRTTTPQAQSYSLDEFFDLEIEGLTWLIPELLPKGETIILAGAPKSGKTLLAIDAAFAIATGESNFLSETVESGRVLIVSVDESARSTQAKLKKRGFRRCDAPNVEIMTQFDIRQMKVLEERLETFRPHLVIIDSLKRINHGQEISENSAEFADGIYSLKETLSRFNASSILIHHTNKNQDALGVGKLRGSSAIAGAVSGVWQLDHIPRPDPNNKKKLIIDPKDPRRILSVFARDTEGQQIQIQLDLENNSWIKQGEVGESQEQSQERATLKIRILDVLKRNTHRAGFSGKEIIELLGIAQEEGRGVYNTLNRLVSQRVVTCKPAPGDKRFNIYSLPGEPPGDSGGNNPPKDSPNPPTPNTKDFLHPPSPTPTVPIGDYYSETHIQQAIPIVTKLVTNSHQLVTNSHQTSNDDYIVTNSSPYTANDSAIVTKLVTNSHLPGGEGVESEKLELVTNFDESKVKPNLLEPPFSIESDRALAQLIQEDGKQKLVVDECKLNLYRPRGFELPAWQPTLEVKPYEQLRRMIIDIETTGLSADSDRIAAIGAKFGGETVIISHQDESLILKKFNSLLDKWQPDVIAAHHGMGFDYPFITRRCIQHKIKPPFRVSDRESCLRATRVNGRPIVYKEVYAGDKKINLIDTLHIIALYDYSARQLSNLKLKSSVLELGLRKEARLELSADEIKTAWLSGNSELITEYLQYDLEDCEMLLDCFLPQIYYQKIVVPGMSLQQLVLRGNGTKWQKILQNYYGKSPTADIVPQCEGAARFAAKAGIFTNVCSVDIASLYPSIQQRYNICSAKDPDKHSLKVLQYLTVERLRLKKLGKSGDLEAKRQSDALKILLNSLTGMLGTNSIGFNDPIAFSLITAYGRAILKLMAKTIEECGGQVCFGDTDGVAFTAPDIPGTYARIVEALPDGIKLDPYEVWDVLYIPFGKGEEGSKCTYLYWKNGEPKLKGGRYVNRDNPSYLREYEIGFLSTYSTNGLAAAQNFHDDFIARLSSGEFPIEQLSCRRIVQLNSKFKHLGEVGQKVRYWVGEGGTYTNEQPYDRNHYNHQIELLHWELLTTLGHEQPKPNKRKKKAKEPSLF